MVARQAGLEGAVVLRDESCDLLGADVRLLEIGMVAAALQDHDAAIRDGEREADGVVDADLRIVAADEDQDGAGELARHGEGVELEEAVGELAVLAFDL
jgi:hypothetical protein